MHYLVDNHPLHFVAAVCIMLSNEFAVKRKCNIVTCHYGNRGEDLSAHITGRKAGSVKQFIIINKTSGLLDWDWHQTKKPKPPGTDKAT